MVFARGLFAAMSGSVCLAGKGLRILKMKDGFECQAPLWVEVH